MPPLSGTLRQIKTFPLMDAVTGVYLPQLLSPASESRSRAQPAASDNKDKPMANKEHTQSLYGSATGAYTLLCAFMCASFLFLLPLLFYNILSVNLNHTSAQRKWQNRTYEVLGLCVSEFRCKGAYNHVHVSKKSLEASKPIMALKS